MDTFDNVEESKTGAAGSNGFQPEERPGSSASSQHSGVNGETFNTLDEPVSETIVSPFFHEILLWQEPSC